MVSYATAEVLLGDSIPHDAEHRLQERSRLLLQLLSDRTSLRLICAPPLFGKTVLARQYAALAFPSREIVWVYADDPHFICDLDAGALTLPTSDKQTTPLVVFDNILDLSEQRAEALMACIDKLLLAGSEVLATTSCIELAKRCRRSAVLIHADELMLDAMELAGCFLPENLSAMPTQKLFAPAALFDHKQGRLRFCASLAQPRSLRAAEGMALTALLLGSGAKRDLGFLCAGNWSELLLDVERYYPYSGLKSRLPAFQAAPLSCLERAEILEAHLSSLVDLSPFLSEGDYLRVLADKVMLQGDEAFAELLDKRYALRAESGLDHEMADQLRTNQTFANKNGQAITSYSTQRIPSNSSSEEDIPVEVSLFGRFDMRRGGVSVPAEGEVRRMGRLLIALAAVNHGKDLPRQWVQRVIWPDTPEQAVRSSYYNLWTYVRRLFINAGCEYQCRSRSRAVVSLSGFNVKSDVEAFDGLCLHARQCVKLEEWECVLHALMDLYRGPLLPGMENAELEAYRSSYQNKMIELLLCGVDAAIKNNKLGTALRFATRAFELDPSREDVCYRYMDIQKRMGQFAGAVTTFLGCRRALVDRFGMEGSRRLDALYHEILQEMA